MSIGTYCKDGGLTFTQGISLDFYFLKHFSEFTVLYYEFNAFKSLEKTTTKKVLTDAERNDEENQQKEVFACKIILVQALTMQ